MVHLNNAGAALPPAVVSDCVVEYLRREEVRGSYELQAEAAERLEAAHASVATLIGARASEIAFVDGSTRAWQSCVLAMPWKSGDKILTSEAEYPSSVFTYLFLKERFGVEIEYVPDDEFGQVDVGALGSAIDGRTRLITATHIPTYSGLINPVAAVGQVARDAGVPFLLDACQSVGQLEVNVENIGCDLLAAGGRKYLRGPRGTGFLWVRSTVLNQLFPSGLDNFSAQWLEPNKLELRPDARRFELFERSPALQLGLGAAADYALGLGMKEVEARVLALGAQLREKLSDVPSVTVQDRGELLGGIVTFTVQGHEAEAVAKALAREQINVSWTPQNFALRAFPQRGLSAVVRASVHYYNTDQELDTLTSAVAQL